MIPNMFNENPVAPIADKMSSRVGYEGYGVRYLKADIDNPTEMAELQLIETKGVDGSGDIILLDRDKYVFMSNYYIILHYLEKLPD